MTNPARGLLAFRMRLDAVISELQPLSVEGNVDVDVQSVAFHPSGVVGKGTVFVCMDEYLEYNRWQTWETHLAELPRLPLAAVVTPKALPDLPFSQVVVEDPRKALGRIARLLTGRPDTQLRLIGTTGTNGKTTTTRLLAHMLTALGEPCGSIGTLGEELTGRLSLPGTYTTPLSAELYTHLARFRELGAEAVSMEVSSHGLALDRVEGLAFDGAILTNVERDHLDFHGTWEAYAEAKRRLFERVKPDGWGILNKSSPVFEAFATACRGQVYSYGRKGSGADLELVDATFSAEVSSFTVCERGREWSARTQLLGRFQVENALAALAMLRCLGYEPEPAAAALASFPPVCGRMEQFRMPNGCTAIVDYAHNPDGLKNLLEAARGLCRGNLHVVFGCGGDRDRGKRPLMGGLAADLADVCWVTSDNPRTEDPDRIIADVLEGMKEGRSVLHRESDRETAIRSAYKGTSAGDLLVVAGKGHEDYQIIGYTRHPFSDQEILRDLINR